MTLSEDASRDIAAAEDELRKVGASIKKVLATLAATKTKATKQPWPIRDLRKLLGDLLPFVSPASEAALRPLLLSLKQRLDAAEPELERAFLAELSRETQQTQIGFGVTAGVRFLGPFELRLDCTKEVAELLYAKQPACEPQPLNARQLSETASIAAKNLLQPPADLPRLFADFEQAHRVTLVREKKPLEGRETRSMLPELFREMQFIRQDGGRKAGSDPLREYSLPRFVVELKSMVQSDLNLESAKRFRLETAVIENTKNAKRSVFVPADLKTGYGEGTYFQALVLVSNDR